MYARFLLYSPFFKKHLRKATNILLETRQVDKMGGAVLDVTIPIAEKFISEIGSTIFTFNFLAARMKREKL